MKKFFSIIIVLVFTASHLFAQHRNDSLRYDDNDDSHKLYLQLYVQASHLFFPLSGGDLALKFPYKIYSAGNPAVNDTFSAVSHGAPHMTAIFFAFPGIEVGYKNFSVDANASLVRRWNRSPTFDYGLNINYRLRFSYLIPAMDDQPGLRNWPFYISVGIQQYHAQWNFGNISLDSTQTFMGLGQNVQSTHEKDNELEPGTMNVYFQETVLAFTPAFVLKYEPQRRFNVFTFRFGPFITFQKVKSGFFFAYRDVDNDVAVTFPDSRFISTNTPGFNASYNDGAMQPFPFKVNGWLLSIRFGFGGKINLNSSYD